MTMPIDFAAPAGPVPSPAARTIASGSVPTLTPTSAPASASFRVGKRR